MVINILLLFVFVLYGCSVSSEKTQTISPILTNSNQTYTPPYLHIPTSTISPPTTSPTTTRIPMRVSLTPKITLTLTKSPVSVQLDELITACESDGIPIPIPDDFGFEGSDRLSGW